MRLAWLLLLAALASGCEREQPLPAQELRVAVAANFAPTLEQLATAFAAETPLKLQRMVGSTGLLTAQIEAGAPFDLFFAADSARPQRLVKAGKTAGPAHSYAYGQLALWMPQAGFKEALKHLQEAEFEHLAIANPELAPYGAAARQTLEKLGLWESLQGRLVRGENVGQAYHYVASGRVAIGFIAWPQLAGQQAGQAPESVWQVPANYHARIVQQVVLLPGPRQALAERFLDFCLGEEGRAIIRAAGYRLPEAD